MRRESGGYAIYSPPLRARRGIRATAWALVAAGVALPVVRRRLRIPRPVVLAGAGLTPAALCVAVPRSRARDASVCILNMWAYLAAYEMPYDDPEALAARVRVDYPIVIDRALGLGVPPTLRLQRAFSAPGTVNRAERVLVWCHWMWFTVPHATVAYVWWRTPDRFPAAAARMYGVFDVGAVFYWAIPTAPPWWAAARGRLDEASRRRATTAASTTAASTTAARRGPRRRPAPRQRRGPPGAPDDDRVRPGILGGTLGSLYDVLGGNPLAAMPSLHFATSLMGAHLLSEAGPVAGAVGWTYALTLGLALVYLGEHYAVDLIGGAALAEGVRFAAPRLTPPYKRVSAALQALESRGAA